MPANNENGRVIAEHKLVLLEQASTRQKNLVPGRLLWPLLPWPTCPVLK